MAKRKSIGDQLRAERLRLGLRQIDVAEKSGLAQATISRIENGRVDPFTTARALVRAGIDMGRLLK